MLPFIHLLFIEKKIKQFWAVYFLFEKIEACTKVAGKIVKNNQIFKYILKMEQTGRVQFNRHLTKCVGKLPCMKGINMPLLFNFVAE